MVNTQLVGCDEQELVNGVNIAKNLEESIAILLLNIIGSYDLNLLDTWDLVDTHECFAREMAGLLLKILDMRKVDWSSCQ
jgi:hypothetical protein